MPIEKKAAPTIEEICAIEGIPITGITIMGGKPYINVTGLDKKLDNLCKEQGLVKHSIRYEEIQRATKENGMRAAGWGIVELFDKAGFSEAIKTTGTISTETIAMLKDVYTTIYKMRGFASPETLQMASMQKQDNIEMMAERRATSRAKREATGTGLTSTDEMTGIAVGKPDVAMPTRKVKPGHEWIDKAIKAPPEVQKLLESKPNWVEEEHEKQKALDAIPDWKDEEVDASTVAEVFDKPEVERKSSKDMTDEEKRDEISKTFVAHVGENLDKIPVLVKKYTIFLPKGKSPGEERSCDSLSRLKGGWLQTTLHRVRKGYEDGELEPTREPGQEG